MILPPFLLYPGNAQGMAQWSPVCCIEARAAGPKSPIPGDADLPCTGPVRMRAGAIVEKLEQCFGLS